MTCRKWQRLRFGVGELIFERHGLFEGFDRASEVAATQQDLPFQDSRDGAQQLFCCLELECPLRCVGRLAEASEVHLCKIDVASPKVRVSLRKIPQAACDLVCRTILHFE